MANGLQINTSTPVGGLGTQTYTVTSATAGLITVEFKCFVPYQAAGSSNNSTVTTGGSGLVVVVNKNGTPALTTSAPSPTEAIVGGSVRLSCVATDVITVVLSSSAAADQLPNAIKSIINLYQGE